MGTKTKVASYLLTQAIVCPLFFLLWFVIVTGCERPLTPPPVIEVEQTDTEDWTGVTIYYRHHYRDGGRDPTYITLNSPEDIRVYKEKVEFLLSRLEEAELRMGIHEDVPME